MSSPSAATFRANSGSGSTRWLAATLIVQAATVAAADPEIEATYLCPDGLRIDAVFRNDRDPRVELRLSDGRHLVLREADSGSGARYVNPDESFVFWNKGRGAFIAEHGRVTHDGCAQKTTAR